MKSYEIERRIRTEARTEGKAEGKAESVLILLNDFGEMPEELKNRILSEKDLTVLDCWLQAARRADNLADFMSKARLTM